MMNPCSLPRPWDEFAAYLFDIDGTLLDSKWKLPEANRAAIAEAARRGIEVALVTGRRYDFAMPIARSIGSPLTMIVSNGALIRTQDGETRLRHLLPRRGQVALVLLWAPQDTEHRQRWEEMLQGLRCL